MAAVAEQQVVALAQRGGQVEAGDAAARAAQLVAVAAEDDGRAVELLEHARGDNAHDADVPGQLALDDDEVGLRVEPGAHGADDFLGDAAFDLLALAVVGVELLRDGQRFGEVAGQEQAQGFLGGFQAAGGIEAGRELEADFVGAEQGRGLGDSFQGDQAGALGGVQAFQAGGNQNAVFAGQRDDVGNGAEGDQVEQGAQVEVGRAGQAGFASALEEGVGELEGEAGGTEFGEGREELHELTGLHGLLDGAEADDGSELGVDQRGGGWRGGGDLVMVQHDDVHAALCERGDGCDGGRAAVHGEQQGGGELRQAILHAVLAEAVAFVHAMRQVVVDLPAERAEHFEQQGGGGDAVHVVIAEDDERFVALAGLEQALDGGGHVRQQERVGQLLEPGLEEGGDGGRFAQAAVQQALGEQRRDFEGARPTARRGGAGAARVTSGISLPRASLLAAAGDDREDDGNQNDSPDHQQGNGDGNVHLKPARRVCRAGRAAS